MPSVYMDANRDLRPSDAYRITCKDPKGILVVKSYDAGRKIFVVGFSSQVTDTGTQVSFGKRTHALQFLEEVKKNQALETRTTVVDTTKLELSHGRGTVPYAFRLVLTQYGPCYIKAYAYANLIKKYYPETIFDTDMTKILPEEYYDFKVSERQLKVWSWDLALRQYFTVYPYNDDKSVASLDLEDTSPETIQKAREYFTKDRIQELLNDYAFSVIDKHLNLIAQESYKFSKAVKPLIAEAEKLIGDLITNTPSEVLGTDRAFIEMKDINLNQADSFTNYFNFFWKNFSNIQPFSDNKSEGEYLQQNFLPDSVVDPVVEIIHEWNDKHNEILELVRNDKRETINGYRCIKIDTEFGTLVIKGDEIQAPLENFFQLIEEFWTEVDMFCYREIRNTSDRSKPVLALNAISDLMGIYDYLGSELCVLGTYFNTLALNFNTALKEVDGKEITNQHPELLESDYKDLILHGEDFGVDMNRWRGVPTLRYVKRWHEEIKKGNAADEPVESWGRNSFMKCFLVLKNKRDALNNIEEAISDYVEEALQRVIELRGEAAITDKLPYSTQDNLLLTIPNSEGNFKDAPNSSWRRTRRNPRGIYGDRRDNPEWKDSQPKDPFASQRERYAREPFMFDPSKGLSYGTLYDKWVDGELELIDLVDNYSLTINQMYNSVVCPADVYRYLTKVYEYYKNRKVRNLVSKVNTDKFKNPPVRKKKEEE